jgi:hypothetical protein
VALRGDLYLRLVWNLVVGPLVALLPRRWRQRVLPAREVQWTVAGTASGLYETLGAIIGIGYWYMYEMARVVGGGVEAADSGKITGASDQEIGGAALTLWWMHPITWLLFYFFFEGLVRLCSAAFTQNTVGSLPFSVVEGAVFWMLHPKEASVSVKENAASFAGAVRERAMEATHKELPDEIVSKKDGADEVLEIRANRRKADWEPPRIVRTGDAYYRLEESWTGKGERPFCYRLRRLAAGVPGRKVIVYQLPEEKR